MVSVSLAI